MKLPVILRSYQKWKQLKDSVWHCLQHREVTDDHIDVHCLNERTVLSARYLVLIETHSPGSVMGAHREVSLSIQLFSDGGILFYF